MLCKVTVASLLAALARSLRIGRVFSYATDTSRSGYHCACTPPSARKGSVSCTSIAVGASVGPIAYIDVEDIRSSLQAMTTIGAEVVQDVKDVGGVY